MALQLPEHPSYLYEPLSYVFSGKGKRLRPILLCIAGKAMGASEHDLKYAGIAVELLHNFTLVHDDGFFYGFTRFNQFLMCNFIIRIC